MASSMADRAIRELLGLDVVFLDELTPQRRLVLRGGTQSIRKTSSLGRRCRSGWRWQSRHHSIVIGSSFQVSGIWSTRPWHETQPTPFWTWIPWWK